MSDRCPRASPIFSENSSSGIIRAARLRRGQAPPNKDSTPPHTWSHHCPEVSPPNVKFGLLGAPVSAKVKPYVQVSAPRRQLALEFVCNGALRFHPARPTHVPNVHETLRNRSALFGFHRLMTAGAPNNGRFIHLVLHCYTLQTTVAFRVAKELLRCVLIVATSCMPNGLVETL